MPIRHNIMMSACCCVGPVLLRQGLHQAPEGMLWYLEVVRWNLHGLHSFWRSRQAVVLLKMFLNHFSFVSGHIYLLSGMSVLPCSCNSLTATSLCTT